MVEIVGKAALVTGGQRGLGRAFVEELLDRGASTVYATARDPKPSEDPRVRAVPLDVTDAASVAALARQAADVDIVFNNAGVLFPGPLLTQPMSEIDATFATNVFGALRVAREFAPVLAAYRGVLVDMHSVLSWGAGSGAYGASKAALWSISNSLRIELAAQHVRVVGVHLGLADTAMTARLQVSKISPARVARRVLDGIEEGENEILVDDVSRAVKSALAGPVEGLTVSLRS